MAYIIPACREEWTLGELLLLGDVEVEVVVAGVLAHDHPLARPQEEHAARLRSSSRDRPPGRRWPGGGMSPCHSA